MGGWGAADRRISWIQWEAAKSHYPLPPLWMAILKSRGQDKDLPGNCCVWCGHCTKWRMLVHVCANQLLVGVCMLAVVLAILMIGSQEGRNSLGIP